LVAFFDHDLKAMKKNLEAFLASSSEPHVVASATIGDSVWLQALAEGVFQALLRRCVA